MDKFTTTSELLERLKRMDRTLRKLDVRVPSPEGEEQSEDLRGLVFQNPLKYHAPETSE